MLLSKIKAKITFTSLVCSSMLCHQGPIFSSFDHDQADPFTLASLTGNAQEKQYYHLIQSIKVIEGKMYDDVTVTLTDFSEYSIGFWYELAAKNWHPGDRLKITYYPQDDLTMCMENIDSSSTAWGILKSLPPSDKMDFIVNITINDIAGQFYYIVTLKSGNTFEVFFHNQLAWKNGDHIYILHRNDNWYYLWNIGLKQLCAFTLN